MTPYTRSSPLRGRRLRERVDRGVLPDRFPTTASGSGELGRRNKKRRGIRDQKP